MQRARLRKIEIDILKKVPTLVRALLRKNIVSSCQLNPCLIKSKVVSEFVGTDKPTEILHSFAEMRICKG